MMETTILRRLPPVSARSALLLSGFGLLSILVSLFAGVYLLIPAGLAFAFGLVVGFSAWLRVRQGHAYPREGKITLVAATFFNGSLAVYVSIAGYILLRFGL
ncbi:MAG TPA: hypothetical protein VNM14_13410 [Planctomycetota bacterium]|jgi:hypothetical protein|nr:hypothetical protein [Planctomycetota bacterium]